MPIGDSPLRPDRRARISVGAPAAMSERTTRAGSSTARRPSKSPARAARRRRRPRAADRARSAPPRRHAHDAERGWRAAASPGERPTIGAIPQRHGEHVVQDEGQAFGRRQRVEHATAPARPNPRGVLPAPGLLPRPVATGPARPGRTAPRAAIRATAACRGTRARRPSSAIRQGCRCPSASARLSRSHAS